MSSERLARYVGSAGGNTEKGLRLYQRNTLLSESLYTPLQGIEVLVRNAFNTQLCKRFGPQWFDALELLPQFQKDDDGRVPKTTLKLRDAKNALAARNKPITDGRIVAELTFGFWVSICAKSYTAPLWVGCLGVPFKGRGLSRADVHLRLDDIRLLRNRVAHHECILDRDLRKDYAHIIEAAQWFCGASSAWIESANSFLARLDSN